MMGDATYSERFNGSQFLDNSLLLSEVGSSDGQGGGGNDWQTDGDTDDQEDQSVAEKGVLGVLGGGDTQVAEETANPGDEDPADDENQKRRTDGVHDGLEVTGVLSTRDQGSSATDERHLGRVSDNTVGLSALATGGVVDDIGDVLVDGEGLSGHGRLINGEEGVSRAVLLAVLLILVVVLALA